jgi:hypothetical protein
MTVTDVIFWLLVGYIVMTAFGPGDEEDPR